MPTTTQAQENQQAVEVPQAELGYVRQAAQEIEKKYYALEMSIDCCLPQTRRVTTDQKRQAVAQFNSELNAVALTKKLFDAEDLSEVNLAKSQLDHLFKQPDYTLTIPDRPGMRFVKVEKLAEFREKFNEGVEYLRECCDRLEKRYYEVVQQQQERLGELYNPDDYPPFRAHQFYRVRLDPRDIKVPAYLRDVDPAWYEETRAQYAALLQDVVRRKEEELLEGVFDITDHLVERLTGLTDDGKPKVFQMATAEKIFDALDEADAAFKDLGMTGSEAAGVFQQLRSAIKGHKRGSLADVLRPQDDSEVEQERVMAQRRKLAEKLQQVATAALDTAVLRPRRLILKKRAATESLRQPDTNS